MDLPDPIVPCDPATFLPLLQEVLSEASRSPLNNELLKTANLAAALRECGWLVSALHKKVTIRPKNNTDATDHNPLVPRIVREIPALRVIDANLIISPLLSVNHLSWDSVTKHHPDVLELNQKALEIDWGSPEWAQGEFVRGSDNVGDPQYVTVLVELIRSIQADHLNAELSASVAPALVSTPPAKKM